MRSSIQVFLSMVLWGLLNGIGSEIVAQEMRYAAKIIKIIDGDSMVVVQNGQKKIIRLYGVDTPEYGHPYADQAKAYVQNRMLQREVQCVEYYKDKYGRSVVMISLSQGSLNEDLVKNGFAFVHSYPCTKDLCKEWKGMEREAQRTKRGLWNEKNRYLPWYYTQ